MMDVLSALAERVDIVDDTTSSADLVDRLVSLGPREEPLHLVELDTVVKRHYDWLRHLPRVRPFYAIKSNDEAPIVETTILLDCGFDCASKAEVQRMLEFGVAPERIIFAQPIKTIESLEFARENKIRTVFDNEAELRKIQQYYPGAEVLIRYRFDSRQAKIQLGVKFGCNPDKEANDLLDLAKELGINVIGWCFNVGSGCSDVEIFYEAIQAGRRITDYASSIGFNFWFIDLGGGFNGNKSTDIGSYAVHINRALDEFFPEDQKWFVIAEPGRFYCAAAHTAVIPVHGKRVFRNLNNPSQVEKIFYYFNDGMYGTFYSAKYRNMPVKPIVWKNRADCGPEYSTFLYGPTCDGSDCFAQNILLPELQISDFLVFENQGAYSKVNACRFNGFCFPKSVVFVRRSIWKLLEKTATSKTPNEIVLASQFLQNTYQLGALEYR
ncbi:ornithine decarboxylase 1-like [Sabethes cyaneus]|uniref:ornithine decarboxylase 1-like n=1 Tax=Sabethes cyaneus TaxID=53552 RepID=UPI00237EC97B|nr:ornithine decarboxylase 1-like [Sabethes cyaneus]